jgi:hypothetical protein
MTDSQAPDRLNYGWVVVLAVGMLLVGLQVSFYQMGASSEAGKMAWGNTLTFGLVLSLPLLVWLVVVWGVYGEKRPWRGRTLLALLPSALLLASMVVPLAWQPSKEQRLRERFRAMFHADLPADAREIDATYPTLADSGFVDFVFRGSRESTQALVKAMNMELQEGVPPHYSRLEREWSDQRWMDALWFISSDKNDVGYMLITDPRMERVLVTRDPLFAKSEDEMHGVK